MTISSIADHAQDCLDRDYLVRWFPDNVRVDGEQFGFSDTELGIVEETLRSLDRNQSIIIHNPLPDNRILIAICLAYARTQDPRFPTKGIVGQGQSLLAFPALSKGYVSTIDDARLDGIGKLQRLVERKPIDKLSQAGSDVRIYSAKHNFEFDREKPPGGVGAMLVDLRKPEWGLHTRRFNEVYQVHKNSRHRPTIFYTVEVTDEVARLQEEVETIEVTSDLLMTAQGMEVPNPGRTAQFGHLLSEEEFEIEHISVGFPQMQEVIKDMVQMKEDLQSRGVANIEVGWLFNLLTKLPVRPEHWDDVTAKNHYQQGVRELLETLRSKASRFDGSSADLLINYCHAGDHLHGLLNREHPVQEEIFNLIEEAETEDIDRVFVVRSDFERQALLRAIAVEDGPSPSSSSIRPLSEVAAGEFDEVVFCRPLDYDSYAYEFPLAQSLKFVQFQSWTDIVKRRIDRGLDVLNADIDMRRVGQFEDETHQEQPSSQGAPAEQQTQADASLDDIQRDVIEEPTFDPEDPITDYTSEVEGASESEVIDTLEQEFKQSNRERQTHEQSDSSEKADLRIELDNGEVRTASKHARVTILTESDDIGRIRAADLSPGDTVVLVDDAANDIYDMFVESAHDKERIRKCQSVVDRWQDTLREGLDEMSAGSILKEIQERGSDITNAQTIELWASGSAIGPRDPEDVRRVLDVLDPEMKPTWEATSQAMKDIRTEHRQIGRQARRAIETSVSSSMASELSESLDDGLNRSDVTEATITDITSLE